MSHPPYAHHKPFSSRRARLASAARPGLGTRNEMRMDGERAPSTDLLPPFPFSFLRRASPHMSPGPTAPGGGTRRPVRRRRRTRRLPRLRLPRPRRRPRLCPRPWGARCRRGRRGLPARSRPCLSGCGGVGRERERAGRGKLEVHFACSEVWAGFTRALPFFRARQGGAERARGPRNPRRPRWPYMWLRAHGAAWAWHGQRPQERAACAERRPRPTHHLLRLRPRLLRPLRP